MTTSATSKLQIENILSELNASPSHSVLLPAPVPQVNPWTQRKSSSANVAKPASYSNNANVNKPATSTSTAEKFADTDRSTASHQPTDLNTVANKENGTVQTEPLQKSKAKISRNEKWVPFTEAEIELSSNKPKPRGKPKKKRTKGKGKEAGSGQSYHGSESRDPNSRIKDGGANNSNFSNHKSNHKASDKTHRRYALSTASINLASAGVTSGTVNSASSTTTNTNALSSLNFTAPTTVMGTSPIVSEKNALAGGNKPSITKSNDENNNTNIGQETIENNQTEAERSSTSDKESASTSRLEAGVRKLSIGNRKASGAQSSSDPSKRADLLNKQGVGQDSDKESHTTSSEKVSNQKHFYNNRNNYKFKNGFKQRNNSFYENQGYGNPYSNGYHGYNKYSNHKNGSGHGNAGSFRNNYAPNGNNYGFFGGQTPTFNPLYAAAYMGYMNPLYYQNPVPPVQYGTQFDQSYKYKSVNASTGYSSDRSFNETESVVSSNSPSRRTSSVGAQGPLPKYGAFSPQLPHQPFYPNGFVPQFPIAPQYPGAPAMPAGFQQPFVSPIPQLQPPNYDPRTTAVIRQLTYYFSLENLIKDIYLRGLMDSKTGGVELSSLLRFQRLKILVFRENKTTLSPEDEKEGLDILRSAIEQIPTLELIEDGREVKIKEGWERWVLPSKAGGETN